jgi:hypothetical protein
MTTVKKAEARDAEGLAQAITYAKYLYDHGAFGPLQQAEFFALVADEVIPPPPPPTESPAPSPAPPPAPAPASILESQDGVHSTATISAAKGVKK